jgi:hypothetical protein
VKSIDEMSYSTEKRRDGRYVGRAQEFRDIRSKPKTSALDAISKLKPVAVPVRECGCCGAVIGLMMPSEITCPRAGGRRG